MAIDKRYLERMQEEEDAGKMITESVFCGTCGYQLKMLPNVGRCPECGSPYNALKHTFEGLFTPQTAEFPAFDTLAAVASTVLLVWLIRGLMQGVDPWALLMTVTFAVLAPIFIRQAWRGIKRYWHSIRLSYEVMRAADDEEEQ